MGTTTNLALPYPASTDYVANGYLDIQNLAQDIDAYFGASTAYTPTFANVTGGAGTFTYRNMGKFLYVSGDFSAGTATAAGSITVTLPAGITTVARQQPVDAGNEVAGAGVLYAISGASGTSVVIYGSAARGNFGAGASLAAVSFSAILEVV